MGLSPLTSVLYRTKNQKYLQNKTPGTTEYFIRMFKFYSKGFGEYPYPVRNTIVSGTRAHFSLFHLMSSYNEYHTVMIILCPGMKERFCHLSKEFFTSRCESAHSLGSSYQNQPLDSEDDEVRVKTDLGQYLTKIEH